MSGEKTLYRGTQIVWYSLYVIESFLLIRFILKLLGANQGVWFTDLVYGVSGVFLAPFAYVFSSVQLGSLELEWSVLLAALVYWAVATGIVKLLAMSRSVSGQEASEGLSSQDNW